MLELVLTNRRVRVRYSDLLRANTCTNNTSHFIFLYEINSSTELISLQILSVLIAKLLPNLNRASARARRRPDKSML